MLTVAIRLFSLYRRQSRVSASVHNFQRMPYRCISSPRLVAIGNPILKLSPTKISIFMNNIDIRSTCAHWCPDPARRPMLHINIIYSYAPKYGETHTCRCNQRKAFAFLSAFFVVAVVQNSRWSAYRWNEIVKNKLPTNPCMHYDDDRYLHSALS